MEDAEPMKIPTKLKYTQLGLLIIFYLALVWLASASFGFLFFIDSNTYINGITGAPVLDTVVRFFPVGTMIIGIINLTLIFRIFIRHGINVFVLFLLFPYNLLLLTNLTKESIIFLSMYLLFYSVRNRAYTKRAIRISVGIALALPRPTYLVLLLGKFSPKILIPLFLLLLLALEVWSSPAILQLVSDRMEGRQYVQHVGRSFFVNLCVAEKSSLLEFSKCWVPVFLGFPIHSDTLSISAIPYYAFQLPYIYLVYKLLKSRVPEHHSLAVIVIFGHFLFLIISPTFGAFIRYAHPFVWAIGFSILRHQSQFSSPRKSENDPSRSLEKPSFSPQKQAGM
ncbi:MAG: hypothetical protein GQ535_17045 [Rhodobacteraceae bacterium]|nr:hypothetical protein [Paracoccaceae bacterium]